MPETMGDRLRRARKFAKLNQDQLAESLGVNQTTVSRWENGDGALEEETSRRIVELTKVNWLWFWAGEGEMAPGHKNDIRDQFSLAQMARDIPKSSYAVHDLPPDIPVYGVAACGDDGCFILNTGVPIDYTRRGPGIQRLSGVFAVYISGDSMSPWKESGQLVYVDPHRPVSINDYILIELRPDGDGEPPRAYIKRLVRRSASSVTVKQFSPEKTFDLPTKDIMSLRYILSQDDILGV